MSVCGPDENCLFCKIVAGKVPSTQVYQDEHAIVFRDIHPKAPVHLLVVPRKHIATLNEQTAGDALLMGHLVGLLPKLALDQGLCNGFRSIINTGPEGGQEVYHLHIHLLGGGGRLPGF